MSLPVAIAVLILELGILLWFILYFVSNVVSAFFGAPYVPISKNKISKLLSFGDVKAGEIFYDFGSGDGRVLIVAKRYFNVAKAIGYDIAIWPFWKSRWMIKRSGLIDIKVQKENFIYADCGNANCVYAYLLPKTIDRLAYKFAVELSSGARIICPSFPIDIIKHPQFALKKTQKIGTLTAYLYQKI